MEDEIIFDIGSSTVKAYRLTNNKQLKSLSSKSFHFKKNFDQQTKELCSDDETGLINYVKKIKSLAKSKDLSGYATGVFRKLSESSLSKISKKMGIKISIVSQEDENRYLEAALTHHATSLKALLIVNIGGGSTELVFMDDKIVSKRFNFDIGVGTILSAFPEINEVDLKENYIQKIRQFVSKIIGANLPQSNIVFFSGGELTFMRRLRYKLESNKYFKDTAHPNVISVNNFVAGNKTILFDKTLEEIEVLYPENPAWTHGSRACEMIAEEIFKKTKISYIVPSDSNMIDGIVALKSEKVNSQCF